MVFRDCSVTLLEQKQLGGYPIDQVPLAVHVPMNSEDTVPEWAFADVPRLRHVSVETGIRLIGAEAWQDCRQLRIVKLPATVVGIADNAFRDCKLQNSILAPGCRDFAELRQPGASSLVLTVTSARLMHPWKRYCPKLVSPLNTFAAPPDAYTRCKEQHSEKAL